MDNDTMSRNYGHFDLYGKGICRPKLDFSVYLWNCACWVVYELLCYHFHTS